MPTLDAERLVRSHSPLAHERLLPPPLAEIDEHVEREHAECNDRHLPPHGEGPQERHAVEEPQEERWVSERCQRATDVRHQEDEEHHGVGTVPPVTVGAQERSDEEHGGACRAHPRGKERSDRHDRRIHGGRPAERPPEVDPAADREERPEENDEGNVVDDHHVHELVDGGPAVGEHKGNDHHYRPGRRDLGVVAVPEARREQREERDREEHSGERQGTPHGEERPELGLGPCLHAHRRAAGTVTRSSIRSNSCSVRMLRSTSSWGSP